MLGSPKTLQWRDAIARHRRILAATLAAIAVLATLAAAKQAAPKQSVVVALHALKAGTTVTADDLSVRSVSTDVGPAARAVGDLVGRNLTVAVEAGQPLFDNFVLTRTRVPAGLAAVPLRASDSAVAALVYAGEQVDVIGQRSPNETATLLASNVTVLTVTVTRSTGLLKANDQPGVVVVLTDVDTAATLAAASLVGPVALALRS